jgi:hypothetical protein
LWCEAPASRVHQKSGKKFPGWNLLIKKASSGGCWLLLVKAPEPDSE